MIKIEKRMWDFIEKNKFIIFLIIITILSISLRMSMYSYYSGDYDLFLKPWFDTLKANGGLSALKLKIGNYNASYMTILALLTYLPVDSLLSIKTVSVIFDYVCAVTVLIMALEGFKENKEKEKIALLLYSAVLFLPTVFINSSCWAQADAIYTAFILISMLFLFKKKYAWAFIFLGISFAFKLQFIFILPLYILMYLSERKFSAFNFLWIIVACFAMCVPSMIFGNTLQNCIDTYIGQVGTYDQYITLNFPNIYGAFWGSSGDHLIERTNVLVSRMGIMCTMAIFILLAYLVIEKRVVFNERTIIEFGLWSVMICTFFLPSMHERYLFIGDILALLYVAFNKDKYYIAVGIELVSLYGYLYLLFGGFGIDIRWASVFYATLFTLYSKEMCKRYFSTVNE